MWTVGNATQTSQIPQEHLQRNHKHKNEKELNFNLNFPSTWIWQSFLYKLKSKSAQSHPPMFTRNIVVIARNVYKSS